MSRRKCSKEFYCQFLIAAQTNFTATNLSSLTENIAHDSISRFLSNTKLTPNLLWEYSKQFVDRSSGVLVLDDSVLDHPHARKMKLAKWQYSGTHHDVVFGIGLTTLLWSNLNEHIPVDFRVYAPDQDGFTKNQHAREMLKLAYHKKFSPDMVLMDSWYASMETVKLIDKFNWIFVTRLRSNRTVSVAPGKQNRFKISELQIPEEGLIVHLKGFGQIKVFLIVFPNGNREYMATNKLEFSNSDIRDAAAKRWKIEEYHRGLKQTTGIEMCQSTTARAQRTHIFCSILSFLALEKKRLEDKITWYEAKRRIIADALFLYLKAPMIPLPVKS